MSAAKMPTDAQGRILLKLLVGRTLTGPRSKVTATLIDFCRRGWTSSIDRLLPAGRDALARWLLRGLR